MRNKGNGTTPDVRPLPAAGPADSGRTGRANIVFERDADGRTFLSHRYFTYPFHITRPFYLDPGWPSLATLYLASASGGLVQGDSVSLQAAVKGGACVHLTTSSATKVHSMERDCAVQSVSLEVERCGYLEYLTEPYILFPGSNLKSRVALFAAQGSCTILGESFLTHNPWGSAGTGFARAFNEISIHGNDRGLLVLDRMCISTDPGIASLPGVMGPYSSQGTIYFVYDGISPEAAALSMYEAVDRVGGIYAGTSALPGNCGALVRLLAEDSVALSKAFLSVWAACRKLAVGLPVVQRRK